MLSTHQIRRTISVHEAGHAVVGVSLSMIVGGVTLDPDGLGGATHCPGERVWNADDAKRIATYLWAGKMAEQLLVPIRPPAKDRDQGEESDVCRIAYLSATYGGGHPLACLSWSLRCRDRALTLLAMNMPALRRAAARIYYGLPIHCMDDPLLFVRRMS